MLSNQRGLSEPLRTRERAALDRARSAFRDIVNGRTDDPVDYARWALTQIATILGEV